MRAVFRNGSTVAFLIVGALLLTMGPASAHVGGDANSGHIVVEIAKWAAALGGALVAIVTFFWIRATLARRRKR